MKQKKIDNIAMIRVGSAWLHLRHGWENGKNGQMQHGKIAIQWSE